MANMPDIAKKLIGIRISIETYHKLLRLAEWNPARVPDVIRKILAAQTEDIELSDIEHEMIAREIRQNREKQGRL